MLPQAISTTVQTPFQWGPYIAVGLAALIALVAWTIRTLTRLLNQLMTDVALVKQHAVEQDDKIEQVRLDVRGVYDTVTRRRSTIPKG